MTVREDVWPASRTTWRRFASPVKRSRVVPSWPTARCSRPGPGVAMVGLGGQRHRVLLDDRDGPADRSSLLHASPSQRCRRAISGARRLPGSSPCPVFAGFEWTDQAIIVDGKRWPILQMEWIDGAPLKSFVRQRLDRQTEIEQLSETWASVVTDLEARRSPTATSSTATSSCRRHRCCGWWTLTRCTARRRRCSARPRAACPPISIPTRPAAGVGPPHRPFLQHRHLHFVAGDGLRRTSRPSPRSGRRARPERR